jgi:glycosyltransferase involved in cell wall biosynthesis
VKPMVSVVITTFNRGAVVVNAVESVLLQTYNNYEIIVVDDGSVDDTATKLRPYFGRIRYHRQDNQGVSAARNMGIELAEGEWIANLDSDDTWHQRKLELQLAALAEIGEEFGACFTNCSYVGDPSRRITAFQEAGFQPCSEIGPLDEPVRWVLAPYPILWVQSLLVKRLLVLESGGFDCQLSGPEDTDLLFRLSFKTKFCFVNQALVNIDVMPNRTDSLSFLHTIGDDRAFSSREIMFQKWLQLLEGKPDAVLQKLVGDLLMGTYFQWAKVAMKRSEWSKFFKSIGKLRRCGVGHTKILGMILSSGMRKLNCAVMGP